MSDALAVAAVTETLRAVLEDAVRRAVPGAVVTARHPEAAGVEDGVAAALNVFLYRTSIDAAWRNTDPVNTHPGETRQPALPLVLHYLLTGYAAPAEDAALPERLLGAAMAALHDRPVLRAAELRAAAGFSDLHLQREPVRVTPAEPAAEELYRLWEALGHVYRLSAAYEARVVFIDSAVPGRTPLPVLRRGDSGRGPEAAPGTATVPWPVLHAVRPAVAAPGAELVLSGTGLDAGTPSVRLTHPLLGGPVVLPARADGGGTVTATVGEELGAGRWSAVVVLAAPDGSERTTGPRPLHIAPRITSALPLTVERDRAGAVLLSVDCVPAVHPGQRAELLVGDLPVPAEPMAKKATRKLRFKLDGARPGRYPLRLRVDGVDSPLTDERAERFDPEAAVVIT
ncbi:MULTISPECIES: DUF4255 domain-containing protein [unclassified Streptomyces]|uniref:DUF4255 domain-containing protein n=1 Tax=unclassified Streptomyces TaxID=2593676 RepID=UPI000939FA6D|nr:DUF4255 domain-containing protein [Streptomyces sp. TSRI0107]OKJ77378.1 hypothetical protein AMK31_28560 [Streptomyces sp. TSRI0107]